MLDHVMISPWWLHRLLSGQVFRERARARRGLMSPNAGSVFFWIATYLKAREVRGKLQVQIMAPFTREWDERLSESVVKFLTSTASFRSSSKIPVKSRANESANTTSTAPE